MHENDASVEKLAADLRLVIAPPLRDAAGIMRELAACRKTFPQYYVRVTAFDSTHGVESITLAFIVNRPAHEPGFRLVRQEEPGRTVRYTVESYAVAAKPEGARY